jgi:site-specific DNA-methyltransferase (adenine-specific)
MPEPYYSDSSVTLYCGRMEDVLPGLGQFDACVTDPPYQETSLKWDRWPDGWPALVAEHTSSMWCFGSMRMFLDRRDEFAGWKMSQDVVWEKHNGSGFDTTRFRRSHEHILHWYRGTWASVHHQVPVTMDATGRKLRRRQQAPAHHGEIGVATYETSDGGPRLRTSVIFARSMHRRAIHATEKPGAVLAPLIEYAVPPGGVVLDPFAGSCSTGLTARHSGRRSVLIEADEAMCERAVTQRLSIPDLFGGVA